MSDRFRVNCEKNNEPIKYQRMTGIGRSASDEGRCMPLSGLTGSKQVLLLESLDRILIYSSFHWGSADMQRFT